MKDEFTKMKTTKKLITLLFCGIFVISTGISGFAAETSYPIPDTEMIVAVPNGAYVFTPETDVTDPLWKEAGIDDVVNTKTLYNELDVSVQFSMNQGKDNIYVSKKTSDQTNYYFNLGTLDQKTLEDFAKMYASDDGTILADSSIYNQKNIPFIRLSLKSNYDQDNLTYELVYFTLVNGYSVSFRMVSDNEISAQSESLLKAMVDSATISQVLPNPVSNANPVLAWSILIGCVLLIVFLVIFSRHRTKAQKRATKELAEMLSEYRKTATGDLGESIYINETVHSKEAIKNFSKYQTYRRHPLTPILSIGISVIGCIVSYVASAAWWITLIIVAVALYCIYKFVTGAGTLERSLTRVYSKLKSDKAHYEFFENEFTISGIQNREVFPYFQITAIALNGNMIYIYFGEGTTYYVSTEGFIKGDSDEFLRFLRSKTAKK